MTRVIGMELRRSAALVVGIGLSLLGIGMLYLLSGPWWKGSAPWNEEWIGLAQWSRYLLVFLSPLALAGGAWQGLRDARSRITELLSTAPRPPWQRALPVAGANAISLVTAFLAILVVGGVQVAQHASYTHAAWLPIAAVGLLSFVSTGLLGFGLGRLIPSPFTPPALVIVGVSVQIVLLGTSWQRLLSPVFLAEDISIRTTVPLTVSLVQALWFLGIGATGYLLAVTHGGRRAIALAPLVAAAAVAVSILPHWEWQVVDPDAPNPACGPTVAPDCSPDVNSEP